MIKSICIIDDETSVREVLEANFRDIGYQTYSYVSCEDFVENRPRGFQGIYLVDWMMPGMKGPELVRAIRLEDPLSPVFMVSAKSKSADIIHGLENGADDFIVKPCLFNELLAKVENALRKLEFALSNQRKAFELIPSAHSFIKDGVTVSLTPREFALFERLLSEHNEVLSREQLVAALSDDVKVQVRNVDVHIFSLRRKIKDVGYYIETIWRKGYKLTSSEHQPVG